MSTTYEPQYTGYKINTNQNKGLGCDTDILDALQSQYEYMQKNHVRVFQVRLDLRYPKDGSVTPQKGDFTKFIKNYTRNLERNYKLPSEGKKRATSRTDNQGLPIKKRHNVDPHITLVVEKHVSTHELQKDTNSQNNFSHANHPHAHVLVHVNGSVKKSAYDIQQRAAREWETVLGVSNNSGLVDFCNREAPCFYMIDRNDPDHQQVKDDAFHQASYLAKVRGKEAREKGSWKVMGTRIPQNNTNDD